MACGDDEGGSKGASCEEICERIEAPACENAAPNCVASCKEEKLNTPVDCESELAALSSCFAGATFHCDANEIPMANACKPQLDRWLECSGESEDPAAGGDGDDDPSGDPLPGDQPDDDDENMCQASPDDSACDSCLKDSCCTETAACGPACQRIADCLQECPDDECMDTCVNENLDGAYQFSQLGTCMVQNCAGSCDLGQ
jgi:hypothetical protein